MISQIVVDINSYSISPIDGFDLVRKFTANFLDGKNYGSFNIDKSSPEMPFIKASADRWWKMCKEKGEVVAPLMVDEELLLSYWKLFIAERMIVLEIF